MKYIIAILVITTALNANAGYAEKIRYWYSHNVSTNVPPLHEIITMQDNSDGQGVHFTWHIENHPSKATIDAIDNAVAVAWAKDKQDTEETDYGKWSDREKAMLKLLVKEINKLRALHNLNQYTPEQVKTALKNELN